jgi:hypothetical protein
MTSTTFTSFQDNNFENDRNLRDELAALNAKTIAATELWLNLGRKLEETKKSLQSKKKFCDLVEAMGSTVAYANKLIRAAKVASNFSITTACILGIDLLAQLAQPKYAELIDDFINHPPQSQLEASDRMKEWRDSQPKKPKTPWKYVGADNTSDGLPREYQAPIVSETTGLIIEKESENANMPPRIFVEKAVQAQSLRERVLSPASFAFVEPKALSSELEEVAAVAEHHKAEAEELKATIKALELEKTSTETTLALFVEQAVALSLNLIKFLLPLSKPVLSDPKESLVRELVPRSERGEPKSDKFFAIGEMVMYYRVIYTVESEPDADGFVECKMANGRSRYLAMQFLKKCEVS